MLGSQTCPIVACESHGHLTVSAPASGLLTLNVIPKKVNDDEITTALCITASAEELHRDLAARHRGAYAKATSNLQTSKPTWPQRKRLSAMPPTNDVRRDGR